jgi:hypothetical protein
MSTMLGTHGAFVGGDEDAHDVLVVEEDAGVRHDGLADPGGP